MLAKGEQDRERSHRGNGSSHENADLGRSESSAGWSLHPDPAARGTSLLSFGGEQLPRRRQSPARRGKGATAVAPIAFRAIEAATGPEIRAFRDFRRRRKRARPKPNPGLRRRESDRAGLLHPSRGHGDPMAALDRNRQRSPSLAERLRPDRHSRDQITVDQETEVAGPVETVAAYQSGHHCQIALSSDGVDFEADVLADELAVALSSDRVGPDKLSAPVVHDGTIDEDIEERFGVVCVRRVEQLGYKRRCRVKRGDRNYLRGSDAAANGHRRPMPTWRITPRPIALRPA